MERDKTRRQEIHLRNCSGFSVSNKNKSEKNKRKNIVIDNREKLQ